MPTMEVHMFREAYSRTKDAETIEIQLISKTARSIPQLQNYDNKGVFSIPVDEAEEVFLLIEEAGVDLQVLG
jgi:hypothetical protein